MFPSKKQLSKKQPSKKLLRKKMPWTVFFVRLAVTFSFMLVIGMYLLSRYRIGIDTQEERCLPDASIYLIDLWDKEPVKGQLFAFKTQGLTPLYADGTRMLKRLTGMPKDSVIIKNETVFINQRVVSTGMALAAQLGIKSEKLNRTLILPSNEYWFSGDAVSSFDSRYWGTVKREQLLGRARPLW